MEENNIIICENCYEENDSNRATCKNCGATLYDNIKNKSKTSSKNEKNQEKFNNQNENNIEYVETYSNSVAKSFKNWSKGVLIVGAIIMVIMIIVAIADGTGLLFIGAILEFGVFIGMSLFLSAIAEIIQKLQNIEDNTRK